jgi:hypothetical protein
LVVLASGIRVVKAFNVEPRWQHIEIVFCEFAPFTKKGYIRSRTLAGGRIDIAPRVAAPRLVGIEVVGRPQLIAPSERATLV